MPPKVIVHVEERNRVVLKAVLKAVWVAVSSEKARKLETALIVIVAGAAAKALGITV